MTQPRLQSDPMILVVGATGLLGHAICEQLRRRGAPVRVLVRSEAKAARLQAIGCAAMRGDLKDPSSLARACAGVTTVVTTANAMLSREPGDSFERVDRDGTNALVRAARTGGATHVVFTSVSPLLPPDNPFVRCKRAAEDAVRASGMTWTILQPTAFMEIHAGPLGGWDFERGRARITGSGRAPLSYVSVADVAAFAAEAVFNSAATNRAIRLAGPEPLSSLDSVAIAERVTGRRFRLQRVPVPALRVMAAMLRPVTAPLASLFRMLIAMEGGEIVDMAPVVRDFGVRQTSFEDYVRRTVAAAGHLRRAGIAGV